MDCIEGGAISESPISNAHNAIWYSDGRKGGAIQESSTSNARDAIRDGDGGEGGAIRESTTSNACYAIRDGNGSEGGTLIESTISNACDAVRNNRTLTASDKGIGSSFNNRIAILTAIVGSIAAFDYHRGEGATIESPLSNTRHTIGDGHRGKGGATKESIISNARDAVRDDCILATCNQGIGGSFNNRIAILTAVVGSITCFYHHGGEGEAQNESRTSNARDAIRDGDGGEGGAIRESRTSNARDTIRDGDGGERGAQSESLPSNARDAVGDGDRGEGAAIIESRISNARDAVGGAIVGYDFGDGSSGET